MKQIPQWEIASIWGRAEPLLAKAINGQHDMNLEGIYQRLHMVWDQAPLQLWLDDKFAVVTQIQRSATDPAVTLCTLYLCGGEDPQAVAAGVAEIESWAKRFYGSVLFRLSGRRGWEKFLDGYSCAHVTLEKRI